MVTLTRRWVTGGWCRVPRCRRRPRPRCTAWMISGRVPKALRSAALPPVPDIWRTIMRIVWSRASAGAGKAKDWSGCADGCPTDRGHGPRRQAPAQTPSRGGLRRRSCARTGEETKASAKAPRAASDGRHPSLSFLHAEALRHRMKSLNPDDRHCSHGGGIGLRPPRLRRLTPPSPAASPARMSPVICPARSTVDPRRPPDQLHADRQPASRSRRRPSAPAGGQVERIVKLGDWKDAHCPSRYQPRLTGGGGGQHRSQRPSRGPRVARLRRRRRLQVVAGDRRGQRRRSRRNSP